MAMPEPRPIALNVGHFDETADRQQLAKYEDQAVRYLLKQIGRPELASPVAARGRTHSAQGVGATFRALDEYWEAPLRFLALRLKWVEQIAFPDLFNRFDRLPFVEDLLQACRLNPEDPRPRAAVFRWHGRAEDEDGRAVSIRDGTYMTCHVWPGAAGPATRVSCHVGSWIVSIQTLKSLLVDLGLRA